MASSRRPKRVRVRRTPPPTLTIEQIDRIIATANADPRLHLTGALVQVLADTGLRSRELCRLRMEDTDVNNNRCVPADHAGGRGGHGGLHSWRASAAKHGTGKDEQNRGESARKKAS